jgi:2-methylcitrate dehydratase PrpD
MDRDKEKERMNMAEESAATQILARYVANTRFEDLSKEVLWEAKRRTADVLAIGLSGSTTASGKGMRVFANEVSRTGAATLWGRGGKVSAEIAALANATMAFHLELDDVHRTSHTHPGISVIPAALAICEEEGFDPKAFLTAVVVGYDVITRIGMAVSPSIYVDRVFLAPGTLAPLGAAAAVASLYRLGEDETAKLLGAAAFLSPLALFEAFAKGAPIKNTAMGWGNLIGIWGAKLCAAGLFGPVTAIEGNFGYAQATADNYDLRKIEDPANVNRGILNTGIKPYSCCRQHHSAVDAILELREKYGLRSEQVEKIRVRTFAVASRGKHQRPDTVAGATYSAPFTVASALTTGACWREQYTEEKIKDAHVLGLAEKVEVVKDDELDALYDEKWPAIVEVWTKDGRLLSARRDIMKGEPEDPVSDQELRRKFDSLTADAVSADRSEQIWETVFRLEKLKDLSELIGRLRADS